MFMLGCELGGIVESYFFIGSDLFCYVSILLLRWYNCLKLSLVSVFRVMFVWCLEW